MSSQQLQMASVPIEHNSLFKPLMWTDSIDTSYWRKPSVEGNYVQHLSLLVEFFHFIYSSFIFYVRGKKQSQIKHICRTKRQGSHQCAGRDRFCSHLLWKAPMRFPIHRPNSGCLCFSLNLQFPWPGPLCCTSFSLLTLFFFFTKYI